MPQFARVETPPIPCLKCGANLVHNDSIGFQWGYCSTPILAANAACYQIGDEILWRQAEDGSVPAWCYFPDNSENNGDPSFDNLIVRESEHDSGACGKCGSLGPDIAIEIADGVIVSVGQRDDVISDSMIILVKSDGSQTPMPDLDRSMASLVPDESGPIKLVSKSTLANS